MAEVIKTSVDLSLNTGNFSEQLRQIQSQVNAFNLTLNKLQKTQGQATSIWSNNFADAVNQTKYFRAEMVKMQTSAGALDSVLKRGSSTLGQFFSAAFNKRGTMATEVFALASERVRTMETQFIATAKSAKGMQEAIAIRPLSAFSSQASIASERMRILSTMFKQGTTQLINFGKNVQWAGRQLMVGFTVPLTIFGGLATKVFRELEKEAVNFKKVYGDIFTTDVEVEKNLDAVKELAKEFTKYGIAAKNTMELAALAAQSGKQGVELQQATIQATRLATLGDIERQQAMRATIALQSAFRMSNEELANSINFLNIVENSSVVSLQNLVEAIPRVAPVIVGLGGDVKDMAVFLAAMQEGGVNAAEAANGLKSSLGRLISPTKQAKEMANEFGISLEKIVEVNEGNVLGMVTTLSEAMKQLSDLQKQQLLSAVFGKFQFARMGALFENITREGSQASKIIEMMDMSIEDMAATADKELSAIEQSVGTQLTGAIERLKLEIAPIGELFAKMAIPIINWLGKIAEWFNGLSDSRKQLLAWGTLIGGVIIPAGTMLFGLLMNLVGTFAKLTQGVGIFTTALVKGGPLGALKAVTQSTKYLSLEEIDAANAARQFGSATNFANEALVRQAGLAKTTSAAIAELTALYRIFAQEQARAAGAQQVVFGTGAVAAGLARRPSRIKSIGLNDGGEVYNINQGNVVPGVGNTDTVPAMLTPGEFVINKQSTKENMPILEAINNGQRLNKGGKVKNNLLYAMAGTLVPKLGPEFIPATGGLFAPIAKSAARRKQSSRTREEIPEGTILKKLNNFVYLLEPNANQQLIGNKIMSGFGSKRGVPLNTLKSQYLSDEGMWMIDAYSGGKWAKTAYRETLKRNFDNIAARYPGKEVRFLDQDGMGRVKDFINSPGYENIQFVSTRELHNKELFSRLTKEHKNRLFSQDTASQMQNRLRSSTGNMENRPTYVDLNSSSYTKRAKSWRGSQRPKGKQAAHVFNMGGMVPVQNFSFGGVAKAISALRPKFGKKDMPILEKMYFREFPKVVEGARLNDAMALRQMGFSLDDINNLFNSSGYFANNILDLKPIQKKLFAEASFLKPSAIRVKTSGKTGADLRWPMLKSQKERANVSNFLKEKGVIGEETSALAFKSRGDRSHFSDVEILKQVKSKNPYSIEGYFSQASLEPREFNKIYARMGLGSPRSAKELEQQRKIFAGILGQEYVSLKNISTVENVSKNVRSPRGWNELMADFGLSRNKGGMIKLNKGGLVPKAVAEHIRNKYPQMSPAIREIVENYVKKTRSNYATMYTKSSEFNTSIDQIMREVGRYGEKHVVNRLGKSFNFNSGGIVPGMQYLFGGGIAQKSKQMYDNLLGKIMLKRSVHGGPSGISSFHGLDKKGWHGSGTYLTKDKFTASAYAQRSLIDSGSMGTASLYNFTSKGMPNVLNLGRKISKSQKEELINTIKSSSADDAYKKVIIDAISKSKTLDEARLVARSLPMMTTNLDDLASMSTKLRDNVSNVIGTNDPSKDLIIGLQSKKTVDKKSIRTLALKLEEMTKSGQYAPSIGGVNFQDDMSQSVIKNMQKFNWKETPIDFKNIPGARKGTQNMFNMFGMDPMVTGMMQASKDPRTAKLLIASIFKPSQFDARQREFLSDLVFGTRGRINLRDSNNPILQALYRKISGTKKQAPELPFAGINKGGYISSKMIKLNDGNIVPGVGNTDTVPAMLTPGEFVVNKDSTKENLALLHSINDGGLAGYNKGGRVKNGILYAQFGADTGRRSASEIAGRYKSIYGKPKPAPARGAGAFGLAAGLAGTLPLMSQGAVETLGPTGSMVASFAGFFAAQKVATGLYNKLGSALSKSVSSTTGVGKAVDSLKKSLFRTNVVFRSVLIPTLGPIAAIAISTVGVFTAFGKTMEKIRKSGEEFNNAMYGSSASLQNMAKSVGRMTPSEQIARQRAETLSGARATQEDVEFSSKFMQTEESKQLIKDLETVKKMGGDQAEALRNQLGQAVLSGIFTPEEAKQIAVDIGLALKNENLSVSAVAQLTNLFGPDGKKLQNNRLEILTEISAPEDIETIVQQSERELERIQKAHFRFWEKGTGYDSALAFQKFFMMFEPDKEALQLTMQMNALQNNIIQNLEKEKQLRSQIELELQNGTISLEKYNKEINLLNKKTSVDSITNAIKATGISEEELSRLKFNAPAGAIGTGILGTGVDPFKTLGGMRYGGIEANQGLSKEALQVENLIERLKDSLKIDLEASGFTEDEITSILRNASESFGNNLEEQAYLFGKILSGEIDAAVFGMINFYRELDPAFSEGLARLAEKEGYITTESVTIPARAGGKGGFIPERTEESVIDRSAEFGTDLLSPFKNAPGLSAAVRSSVAGNQAPGQGMVEDPVMYAKRLTTAYQTIQALPKDLVFALKLDVDSPIDIFKYNGQDIESFKRNWNVLDGLDPALDKTFVFNAIGVDSNGKPRPIDDLIQDTKAVNKAIEDLNSGDKKVVAEAELKLFTLLNQNSDMTSEQIENELNTLKESYKDIWDSVDAGTKSSILLFTALVNGLDPVKDAEAIKALEQQIQSLVDLARVQTTDDDKETGAAKESAFQKIMKSTKATKDYMKAVAGLVKTGLKPENIALIDQADLLEMSVAERKKAIKAVKEQMNIQKALEYLMKSTSERRIFDLEREVKVYDRNIELIERQIEDVEKLNKVEQDRIETLSRQNEMDQRQLAIRSRGLELLSRKEDEVNKVYDARAEALDKVSEINERVARQQQSRISLATALTSGDIAGAASAAAQMAAQYAQDQEEDARKALESQRQRELENLAVSINGVLMTRSQIEAQILQINDRIYDRNLEIEKLEDIIYHRKQTLIKPLEEDINRIMEDRKVKLREIEDLQFINHQNEMKRIDQLIKKYNDLNIIKGGGSGGGSSGGGGSSSSQNSSGGPGPGPTVTSKPSPNFSPEIAKDKKTSGNTPSAQERIANDKKTSGNTPPPPPPVTRRDLKAFGGSIKNFAMGGSVKKYAMGGMTGFRGSREAPPAIKMSIGNVVPGLGNTDRVPALLTPGEFVVRKSVAAENMGLLKSLNGDVFPNIKQDDVMADPSAGQSISSSINNMPIYNSYSVNVNVPNTNASPEEIANAVMSRIQRSATATIRTTRR